MDNSERKSVEIGKRLKDLRGSLSQTEMAKQFQLPFRTYFNYESGLRIPPALVLNSIANKYDVTVDWILTGQSQVRQPYPVNVDLIKDVIIKVEEIFNTHRLHLSPEKKAELIVLLYEELLEDESNKLLISDKVLKLVKLAS